MVMTTDKLRKKYPVFEYRSFHWEKAGEDLFCSWIMKSGDLAFNPTVTVKNAGDKIGNLTVGELDNLVFHLGLADIFSYWKATCSPKILISAGHLDATQVNWWHDLLIKGMGQYFYENQIDFKEKNFVTISSGEKERFQQMKAGRADRDERILVPVGGGKDSAVALDLLTKQFGQDKVGAFAMNLAKSDDILPAAERISDEAKVTQLIRVHRQLDPQVFSLKNKGFLDGHIPFTAYLSFLSVILGRLFGYSILAFSNERSANEGNVDYLGQEVNHQFSKSFEFEQMFREYNQKFLGNLNYFSFLRPLYELQIMKLFSQMNKYFPQFRSCNIGYKDDSWCGHCPKCLAVFVGLYPYVDEKVLVKIFKHNLLNDKSLVALTRDILGIGRGKPFECIGTFEETIVAFNLCLQKHSQKKVPVLLKIFRGEVLPRLERIEKSSQDILQGWDKNNNLPQDFGKLLKKHYEPK